MVSTRIRVRISGKFPQGLAAWFHDHDLEIQRNIVFTGMAMKKLGFRLDVAAPEQLEEQTLNFSLPISFVRSFVSFYEVEPSFNKAFFDENEVMKRLIYPHLVENVLLVWTFLKGDTMQRALPEEEELPRTWPRWDKQEPVEEPAHIDTSIRERLDALKNRVAQEKEDRGIQEALPHKEKLEAAQSVSLSAPNDVQVKIKEVVRQPEEKVVLDNEKRKEEEILAVEAYRPKEESVKEPPRDIMKEEPRPVSEGLKGMKNMFKI